MGKPQYRTEFYVHDKDSCFKVPFETKGEAKRQNILNANCIPDKDMRKTTKKCRPYLCPKCGYWHLTSMKAHNGKKKWQRHVKQQHNQPSTRWSEER